MTSNSSDVNPAVDAELYPALIQCFFIIAVGYIAGQLNLLTNAHAVGLSRYISNFALPGVIFVNLVSVQFQSVSWRFLCSVLIAKTIVFFIALLMTLIAERPRNFASMGEYAIMSTQSNDFALILPIIDAVYRQSHPDFARYVYLIAPISLVILNPIGFCLIEIQKRIDDQRKHRHRSWQQCQLISVVFRNISRNPVVLCTLLGVIFNQIFHQKLPHLIESVLTPIGQSFSATALFYLGLMMVGKLNRLQPHIVATVCLISIMKLIVSPLILRQAVFFLMKSTSNNLSVTIDYSNMAFLYGTAPTAPSVIFYVPESNFALQAIASTSLVVCTILSGPIILISAKMINLRALDVKVAQAYESLLANTAYDVSFLSLFCTIIVLIGFLFRRRWLKTSYIHQYTFIFVGLQMIHALWTIATYHFKQPIASNSSAIIDIGTILIALTTRTWATSLSIILMMLICHSNAHAQRYFWFYHVYGWIVPACLSLAIYFGSSPNRTKEKLTIGAETFGNIQLILSISVLVSCIIINSICLLRIARRSYRLKHIPAEQRRSSSGSNEGRPLMNEGDVEEATLVPSDASALENDTQLLRHGILVTFLTIDAFVCVSVLLWVLLAQNRDGIYYELQFLDTVLLHGQGIISFLIFALDADFLVPMMRMLMKMARDCGYNGRRTRDETLARSLNTITTQEFEFKIRPDFIRHTVTPSNLNPSFEKTFNGSDFCQWLVANGFMANELTAKSYLTKLLENKQLICINQNSDELDPDLSNQWFAFSK